MAFNVLTANPLNFGVASAAAMEQTRRHGAGGCVACRGQPDAAGDDAIADDEFRLRVSFGASIASPV